MSRVKSIQDPEVQVFLQRPRKNYHPSPLAWEDQILYFMLPDRFSDGQENDYLNNTGFKVTDGVTPPYKASENGNAVKDKASKRAWLDAGARFCGGTLKGAASKLGYLKRMGVTALWIGPIFKQVTKLETYHGYGVQNFLNIDPRFGSPEDLQDLVKQAHQIGIYVVLDIILNHTGNVFQYQNPKYPVYDKGKTYDVRGYYDADRNPVLPFTTVDLKKHPNAFPDGAIWPVELQNGNETFTRKGQIRNWDANPEYLDGDFFDLKDVSLGKDAPDHFKPTPALKALVEIYKFWIAFADLDAFRLDTVKHMGHGPTRYFAGAIHEFATSLGKENFFIIGEIAGSGAFETVEVTGLDAALGIGDLQQALWKLPKGMWNPQRYFDLFRNAIYLQKGSHSWLRNKVVMMLDDHDQIWRGNTKGRFCSDALGPSLIFAALALNLTTLGIPCIYYGTEQAFDGVSSDDSPGHHADQYIRETMFGGGFGAFRSRNVHFFLEKGDLYRKIGEIAAIRRSELALRRGRQYLREMSAGGRNFRYPTVVGERLGSMIAWSRVFNDVEILCAINTDVETGRRAWVSIDADIHAEGDSMTSLYGGGTPLTIRYRGRRAIVDLCVPPAAFVMFRSR